LSKPRNLIENGAAKELDSRGYGFAQTFGQDWNRKSEREEGEVAGFLWGVMRSGFRWNWGKDLSSHQWVVFDSLISAAFLLGRVWISDLGRVALWQLRLGFGGNRRVRGRSEKKIKNKEKD
jgi:hypothetical protein